jgi:hypothetical protein
LQFDLAGVSGTNQYRVWPLALVSTGTPPTVAAFRAAPAEAGPDAAGAGELAAGAAGFDDDELPHPAASSAAAASPAAAHRQPPARCPGGRPVA